jgi:putative heme-binding domain-containing protein
MTNLDLLMLAIVSSLPVSGAEEDHPVQMPRLLVFTLSAGFEHDVVKRPSSGDLSLVERALVDLGRDRGGFEAVPSRDPAAFERESLNGYAGVLFYTTGELPLSAPQRTALMEAIAGGKGFVGIHPATDTFYQWPEYGALVGGYFDGHPWHEKVRVRVEDRQHAATRDLDGAFDIVDEIYQFRAPYDRARLHVLLSLDPESIDLKREGVKRTDRDFALAWTREQGQGRVFYTALGHRPEVWADPRFRAHLAGGIEWSLRLDRAPPLLPLEDEPYRAFARENPGDPKRGFAVFRRESGPMCLRCHRVYGEGGEVGPDLSDLAREHTREEILEQVLSPSARIEDGFRATSFELKDGTIVTGRVRAESKERIDVWDAEGRVREIAPDDVMARRESDVSAMPAGLARTLSKEEFADLMAWLLTLKGS